MKFIIKDNQEFRILPIWNGLSFDLNITARYAHIDNKLYYDLDGKLSNKIWLYKKEFGNQPYYSKMASKVKSLGTRYFYSVILNGEIGYIEVGKSLNDIITNEFDGKSPQDIINSSRKLKISKVDVSFGFDTYADYKKSIFTDGDKLDIDLEWIKKNQFNFFEYINKMSILANRHLMDSDVNTMLSYFLSEIREEKINNILN